MVWVITLGAVISFLFDLVHDYNVEYHNSFYLKGRPGQKQGPAFELLKINVWFFKRALWNEESEGTAVLVR